MILPLGNAGPLPALALGAAFGFILERGGLGNGCKLTGQLRLEDWTVFNVMFTAVIVAASGLWLLNLAGLMTTADVYVPQALLGAALAGGALVGLGMSVGGYCPGTSVVAACSGRVDGVVFFLGLIAGTLSFAGLFSRLGPRLAAATPLQESTLQELLHVPGWLVILVLAGVAIGVHKLTSRRVIV